MSERYDVAIVGASVGGCTAARLFAQRGASVALIERKPDPDAYKTVCTHYVQSSATPTIERLGPGAAARGAGAVHNSIDLWTRHGGWIVAAGDAPFGYSVTRRDPRPAAARAGRRDPRRRAARRLDRDRLHGGGRPARRDDREQRAASRARSTPACSSPPTAAARSWPGWPRVPARSKPNRRFFYWAYWRGLRARPARARGCGCSNPTAPTPSPTRTG